MLSYATFEAIETFCPWCHEYIMIKIRVGQNKTICDKCKLPWTLQVTFIKNYEELTEQQKQKARQVR